MSEINDDIPNETDPAHADAALPVTARDDVDFMLLTGLVVPVGPNVLHDAAPEPPRPLDVESPPPPAPLPPPPVVSRRDPQCTALGRHRKMCGCTGDARRPL